MVDSSQLFPAVVDASTLIARPTSNIFLPLGIEGGMSEDGDADVGTLYEIKTITDARAAFGANSTLTKIISEALKHGAGPCLAAASNNDFYNDPPALEDRQTVWDDMASDPTIRLRLTDSIISDELAALAQSCTDAELVQNKQVAVVGTESGTDINGAIAVAAAINSSRCILVAPAIFDEDGVLIDGSYAAAGVAAELAKNPDPSNDLDLWTIPLWTAIEKNANQLPVFRHRVSGGIEVNDFETLLQGGVSPLMPTWGINGVQTSHIRTTYTTDEAYDAFSTRLIVDQVFLDIKQKLLTGGYLRKGNTPEVRGRMKADVTALLFERMSWIQPIQQIDNTAGYNVTVISSNDERQVTVGYQGQVVRGIQTIQVAGNLSIPV